MSMTWLSLHWCRRAPWRCCFLWTPTCCGALLSCWTCQPATCIGSSACSHHLLWRRQLLMMQQVSLAMGKGNQADTPARRPVVPS